MSMQWLKPDWPAPNNVIAFATTRRGGVSGGCYAGLNLGGYVGDNPESVARNRALVSASLPSPPAWLNQVHGVDVVAAESVPSVLSELISDVSADASYTRQIDCVSAVMTADCLPVLFTDTTGSVVAAAHAGWRGLAAGVLENTVAAMAVAPSSIMAWMGPALGPARFEVGADVLHAFGRDADAFTRTQPDKWLADIFALARARLGRLGVAVYGGGVCTYESPGLFYSHRRATHHGCDTGRLLSGVYLSGPASR